MKIIDSCTYSFTVKNTRSTRTRRAHVSTRQENGRGVGVSTQTISSETSAYTAGYRCKEKTTRLPLTSNTKQHSTLDIKYTMYCCYSLFNDAVIIDLIILRSFYPNLIPWTFFVFSNLQCENWFSLMSDSQLKFGTIHIINKLYYEACLLCSFGRLVSKLWLATCGLRHSIARLYSSCAHRINLCCASTAMGSTVHPSTNLWHNNWCIYM